MQRATDCLFVQVPTDGGTRTRRWNVTTPRATDAQWLRARFLGAAPRLVEAVMGLVYGPELKAASELDGHEAVALLYRNARAGRCIRALFAGDGPIESDKVTDEEPTGTFVRPRREPGVQFAAATQLLDLVRVRWAEDYARQADHAALFGEYIPGRGHRVGLLPHLAYACDAHLSYDSAEGYLDTRSVLLKAGSPELYAHRLDDVALSADELDLVYLLCLAHAWRPF